MADGREAREWDRVVGLLAMAFGKARPADVIPARLLDAGHEPRPERTPEQRKAESDAAFRVMATFFAKMQPR